MDGDYPEPGQELSPMLIMQHPQQTTLLKAPPPHGRRHVPLNDEVDQRREHLPPLDEQVPSAEETNEEANKETPKNSEGTDKTE